MVRPSELSSFEVNKYMHNDAGLASRPSICAVFTNQLLRWQVEALRMMDDTASRAVRLEGSIPDPDPVEGAAPIPILPRYTKITYRKVCVVYNKRGCIGRTTFLRAIQHDRPQDFAIFDGVPRIRDFISDVRGLRQRGWTGHTIIFDLYRQFKEKDIYRTIEAASDDVGCSNVWVFTYRMLDLSEISEDRWQLFTVTADVMQGLMSNLIPITLEDAKKTYQIEAIQRARASD